MSVKKYKVGCNMERTTVSVLKISENYIQRVQNLFLGGISLQNCKLNILIWYLPLSFFAKGGGWVALTTFYFEGILLECILV